jgi:hypothetical protein
LPRDLLAYYPNYYNFVVDIANNLDYTQN